MIRLEGRSLGLALLFILGATAYRPPAQGQTPVTLGVSSITAEGFPTIRLTLTVADAEGQHIPRLTGGNFAVTEDGVARPDASVKESEIGSRQIFAILTGQALRIRDSQGRTRFDFVRQALLEWWAGPNVAAYELDDLSLVTSDGPLAVHASAQTLSSALTAHQPTFTGEPSGYDFLTLALGYMSDPPPNEGMPGSLVLFSPPLDGLTDVLLENVVARAKETGTVIYPVLVGPPDAVDSPGADRMRQLAVQTGGAFEVFDPGQGLEALAQKVIGRRFIYTLGYTSQANTSGTHQIEVHVKASGAEAATLEQSYQVQILPPQVSFIQPPSKIVRESDDTTLAIEQLPPTTQDLPILIDFPDGHTRPITRATLYVDDAPESELDAPPFNHFTLDLTRFIESGSHTLRVETEDSLGLSSTSEPTRLEIEVRPPPRGLAAVRPALGSIAAALGVLVLGAAVAVSLMSAGRRQAASLRGGGRARGFPRTKRRASLHERTPDTAVEAMLVPVDNRGQEGEALPLTGIDVILGRDASLAGIVLDDPSVSGMHARMIRLADGGYLLRDQDSIAGTWINFRPVTSDGTQLAHEDLIHIGRVGLRFRQASPPPPREIRVRPLAGEAEPPEDES
jgi:hypothetical protein